MYIFHLRTLIPWVKYISAQNSRHWSNVNPRQTSEVSLYDQKIGVWCAITPTWILGPVFSENTITSEWYVKWYSLVLFWKHNKVYSNRPLIGNASKQSMGDILSTFCGDEVFKTILFTFRNERTVHVYNARRISHDARLMFFGRWWGHFGFSSRRQESVAIWSIGEKSL
jgi:hypothetical protein